MRTAILTDVHANIEALTACVAAAEQGGADRFVCLGDTVGYGANPNEACDFIWLLDDDNMPVAGALTVLVHRYSILEQSIPRDRLAVLSDISGSQKVIPAIFELVDIAGLRPKEAAAALGLTPGTVRMRLMRARARLRKGHSSNQSDQG